MIDVGHGNATVFIGDQSVAIVDCGPGDALIRFLDGHGISRIEAVYLSHADKDHIGGVMALLARLRTNAAYSIGHVYLNPDPRSTVVWNDLVHDLAQLHRANRTVVHGQISEGEPPALDLGGCVIEVLAPTIEMALHAIGGRVEDGARPTTANSMSAVILASTPTGRWILLSGDLDFLGLDQLRERNVDVAAPVLVFPHHGGLAGSEDQTRELTTSLLQLSAAQTVIFSVRSNDPRFPSPVVIESLTNLAQLPVVLSVGDSPTVATLIAHDQPHRNGTGTIEVPEPDRAGLVRF